LLHSWFVAAANLTPQEVREIAARACCDPRTVRSYLERRRQHSTTAKRIERAIVELHMNTLQKAAETP
jgi:hypothetical protein